MNKINSVLDQKIQDQLESYPNLKKYVEHYIETDGEPEDEGCISNLVCYFKLQCLKHNLNETKVFKWNKKISDDFYTWGTNSRWSNTFDTFLYYNFQYVVEIGISLAEKYGDIDVDKE